MNNLYSVGWMRRDQKQRGVFSRCLSIERAQELARDLNTKYPDYVYYVVDHKNNPVELPQVKQTEQERGEKDGN